MLNVLVLATAPVWALLTFFYVRDKYDKEPRGLLIRVFVYGMAVTLVAAVVGVLAMHLLATIIDSVSPLYLVIENFLIIALVEEGLKYWVVRRQTYCHPAFNEPYDGMIYAITASLGFAGLENILYVAQGGLQVAVMRALLAVPGHALFASAMGYYFGRAKFARTAEHETHFLRMAVLVPVLLHGVYDLLLSTGRSTLALGVVPLSIGMWIMALRQVGLSQMRSPFRP